MEIEANGDGQNEEEEVLRLAASVEKGNDHPLGAAILAEANNRDLPLSDPVGFQVDAGRGVRAEINGKRILVGNRKMMDASNINLQELDANIRELEEQAKTIILLAVDDTPAGLFGVADTVRDGSKEAIVSLHRMGLQVAMITVDNQRTAEAIAQ